MAYILRVGIIDGGDRTIKVVHEFNGATEREVRTYYREHLHSCEYFRSADKEDRVLEELEQVSEDELPTEENFFDDDDDEEEIELDA